MNNVETKHRFKISGPDSANMTRHNHRRDSGFSPIGFVCRSLLAILIWIPCAASLQAKDDAGFRTVCGDRAAAAAETGTMTVPGEDGWLFLARELRHIAAGKFWGEDAVEASQATRAQDADPLPAILDFKEQLDELDIELIIVPVPPKAIIYPDKLTGHDVAEPPARLDPFHAEFYEELRSHGIEVLDLTDDFLQLRCTDKGPMYAKQDSHWSGIACNFTSERLSEIITQRAWYNEIEPAEFDFETSPVEISGDLWLAIQDEHTGREELSLRFVGKREDGRISPIQPDRNSPVILLGDSHTLVYHAGSDMHATGAGLADQLALELGFPVELIGVRGSGATPARINLFRRGRANPNYFNDKKLIIWCFSAREFTESDGWRKVPVTR